MSSAVLTFATVKVFSAFTTYDAVFIDVSEAWTCTETVCQSVGHITYITTCVAWTSCTVSSTIRTPLEECTVVLTWLALEALSARPVGSTGGADTSIVILLGESIEASNALRSIGFITDFAAVFLAETNTLAYFPCSFFYRSKHLCFFAGWQVWHPVVLQNDTRLVVVFNKVICNSKVSQASLEFSSWLVALSLDSRVLEELDLLKLGGGWVCYCRASTLGDSSTENQCAGEWNVFHIKL